MKQTAGKWNPNDKQKYFAAGSSSWLRHIEPIYKLQLVAINELAPRDRKTFDAKLAAGITLFVDSGVYSLAAETARARNITHDAALRMPIHNLKGFQELYDQYVWMANTFQDKVWGMVELDLGGREQKIKTRAGLEKQGIRPIPVYHPLNDGWDYFDELLSNYDRICIGNIVNASRYVRRRIIATVWERKMRTNPKCWIHVLGLTMNEWMCAYPLNSCDSSSWLSALRWSGYIEKAGQKAIGPLPKNFQYKLADSESCKKGASMAAVGIHAQLRNLYGYGRDMTGAGIVPSLPTLQRDLAKLELRRLEA